MIALLFTYLATRSLPPIASQSYVDAVIGNHTHSQLYNKTATPFVVKDEVDIDKLNDSSILSSLAVKGIAETSIDNMPFEKIEKREKVSDEDIGFKVSRLKASTYKIEIIFKNGKIPNYGNININTKVEFFPGEAGKDRPVGDLDLKLYIENDIINYTIDTNSGWFSLVESYCNANSYTCDITNSFFMSSQTPQIKKDENTIEVLIYLDHSGSIKSVNIKENNLWYVKLNEKLVDFVGSYGKVKKDDIVLDNEVVDIFSHDKTEEVELRNSLSLGYEEGGISSISRLFDILGNSARIRFREGCIVYGLYSKAEGSESKLEDFGPAMKFSTSEIIDSPYGKLHCGRINNKCVYWFSDGILEGFLFHLDALYKIYPLYFKKDADGNWVGSVEYSGEPTVYENALSDNSFISSAAASKLVDLKVRSAEEAAAGKYALQQTDDNNEATNVARLADVDDVWNWLEGNIV